MSNKIKPSSLTKITDYKALGEGKNHFFPIYKQGENYTITLDVLKQFIGVIGGTSTVVDFTNVDSNIIPSEDNTKVLGNAENAWKSLTLGESLNFKSGEETLTLRLSTNADSLVINKGLDIVGTLKIGGSTLSDLLDQKQDVIGNLSDIISDSSKGAIAYNWGNHATVGYVTSTSLNNALANKQNRLTGGEGIKLDGESNVLSIRLGTAEQTIDGKEQIFTTGGLTFNEKDELCIKLGSNLKFGQYGELDCTVEYSNATADKAGLMSSTDKQQHDSLWKFYQGTDTDSTINKLKEIEDFLEGLTETDVLIDITTKLQGQIDGLWSRDSFDDLCIGHLMADSIATEAIYTDKLNIGDASIVQEEHVGLKLSTSIYVHNQVLATEHWVANNYLPLIGGTISGTTSIIGNTTNDSFFQIRNKVYGGVYFYGGIAEGEAVRIEAGDKNGSWVGAILRLWQNGDVQVQGKLTNFNGDSYIHSGNIGSQTVANANQLGGHDASYFATKDSVSALSSSLGILAKKDKVDTNLIEDGSITYAKLASDVSAEIDNFNEAFEMAFERIEAIEDDYLSKGSNSYARTLLNNSTVDIDNLLPNGLIGGKLFGSKGTYPSDADNYSPFLSFGVEYYECQLIGRRNKLYIRSKEGETLYSWNRLASIEDLSGYAPMSSVEALYDWYESLNGRVTNNASSLEDLWLEFDAWRYYHFDSVRGEINGAWSRNSFDDLYVGHAMADSIATEAIYTDKLSIGDASIVQEEHVGLKLSTSIYVHNQVLATEHWVANNYLPLIGGTISGTTSIIGNTTNDSFFQIRNKVYGGVYFYGGIAEGEAVRIEAGDKNGSWVGAILRLWQNGDVQVQGKLTNFNGDSYIHSGNIGSQTVANANQLGGHDASYFATKDSVSALSSSLGILAKKDKVDTNLIEDGSITYAKLASDVSAEIDNFNEAFEMAFERIEAIEDDYLSKGSNSYARTLLNNSTVDIDNLLPNGLIGGKLFGSKGTYPSDADNYSPFLSFGVEYYECQLIGRRNKLYIRSKEGETLYSWNRLASIEDLSGYAPMSSVEALYDWYESLNGRVTNNASSLEDLWLEFDAWRYYHFDSVRGEINGAWSRNSFDDLYVGHAMADSIAAERIYTDTLEVSGSVGYDIIKANKVLSNTNSNYGIALGSAKLGSDLYGMSAYPIASDYMSLGSESNYFYYAFAQHFQQSSDATLKNVIGDVDLTVREIANAPAVEFTWKRDGRKDVGTIAQYWKDVLPEVVSGEEGSMGMNYATLGVVSSIVLARSMETHEERISRLERENEELRTKVSDLTKRLNV